MKGLKMTAVLDALRRHGVEIEEDGIRLKRRRSCCETR